MESFVKIVNSFTVAPMLKHRINGILKIAISSENKSTEYPVVRESWMEIISEIKKRNVNIPIVETDEPFSYANVTIKPPLSIHELINKPRGLWIGLDLVEDHRNLGMILRTASFYGVNGVLMKVRDKNSATLNQEIMMNSCGGIESLDYAFCESFQEVEPLLKKLNFSIVVAHVEQGKDMADASECNDHTLVILGNEYNGVSDEAAQISTHRICIPFAKNASVNCLNVANCNSVIIDRFRDKIFSSL